MAADTPITFEAYAGLRRLQIAETVKQCCTDFGWTMQQLADFLKWPASRLEEIEAGKSGYTLEELEILSVRFGFSLESMTALTPREQVWLHLALTAQVTQSALGKRLEIPLPADQSGLIHLYHPVFAPDGAQVVCSIPLDETGQILAWDTQSGDLAWRYDHPTIIVGRPVFSPDGQYLAFATTQDTVIVLRAADRSLRAILDPVEQGVVDDEWWTFVEALEAGYGQIAALCFSPDGKRLAVCNEATGTLRLWNTHSWQPERTLYLAQLLEQELRARHWNPEVITWKYGEVAITDMCFTLDGTAIALWSDLSAEMHYFPLHGQSAHTRFLGAEARCYVEVPVLSPWTSARAVLHLAGGSQQSLEIWHTANGNYTRTHEEQHAAGRIFALKVIDHQTILALVEMDARECPLTLKNIVNNQLVVLAEQAQSRFATFSADGAMLAYVAPKDPQARPAFFVEEPVLFIQHLHLDALRSTRSLADFPYYQHGTRDGDLLRQSLPPGGKVDRSAAVEEQVDESFADWTVEIADEPYPLRQHFRRSLVSGKSLRDRLELLEQYGLSGNAQREGVYVALPAQLPRLRLPDLVVAIQQEVGIPTRLVDLIVIHIELEALSSRELAEAIVGRELLRGESTPEVIDEIREDFHQHILFLSGAERLSTDTLVWLVSEARQLVRMVFLVVWDEVMFQKRIGQYSSPGWLEGRMEFVDLNELRGG